MRKIIGIAALAFAFLPLAQAEESVGDKAVNTKREAGAEIRHAGREVKHVGREARQTVITRCADGRHTLRGKSGCLGHGGVFDPK